MTTTPNQVEPSREQVERIAIGFVAQLNGFTIPIATAYYASLPPLGKVKYDELAKWHLTETATLTQQLTAAQAEREADMRSFNETAKFSTELIASLQQQLTAAKGEVKQLQLNAATLLAEKLDTDITLISLRAQLHKEHEAPLCADHAQVWFTARNTLGDDCVFCKQDKRILELEARVAHLDAFAGSQSVLLNQVLAQLRNGGGTGHVITAIDEHLQLRNPGNTLVERVKGLETLVELGNSISTEVAAYGECHCENYKEHGGKCPCCEAVDFIEQYKALTPTKATDE